MNQDRIGGLGGLGGFLRKPQTLDAIQAMGFSALSSPSNNPMKNVGAYLPALQGRRQEEEQRGQSKEALIAVLEGQGIPRDRAMVLSANPAAAEHELRMINDRRERAKARQRQEQLAGWVEQQNPDLAGLAQVDPDAAMKIATSQMGGQRDTTYGTTVMRGTDAEGNQVLGVIGNDGSFKPLDNVPEGFQEQEPYQKLDAGTHFELRDRRTGQLISVVPKENYQEGLETARGTAEGKAMGEEAAVLRDMQGNMPGLETTMDDLRSLSEKATFTFGGQTRDFAVRQLGGTTEGALARTQYEAIVNNQILPLLRQTFGAQFTVEEGRQLRATLGDPNKSPSEKQAVLEAFIAQKRRDLEAQRVRAGKRAPADSADQTRRFRYNPNTGELE